MLRAEPCDKVNKGGAGGLAVHVKTSDQRAMGWQGLTSRQCKKVAPPNINTAQQSQTFTKTDLLFMSVCVCVL